MLILFHEVQRRLVKCTHIGGSEVDLKGNAPTMPLNDAEIRTLEPKEKPYKAADFDGLYLTVTPSGSRLTVCASRPNGRWFDTVTATPS